MIVLDTSVVSEAMKPEPNPAVKAWLNKQSAETLYLTSITLAELLFGIAVLPHGKCKDMLSEVLGGLMELFNGRILSFDADAARQFASLAAQAMTNDSHFLTKGILMGTPISNR